MPIHRKRAFRKRGGVIRKITPRSPCMFRSTYAVGLIQSAGGGAPVNYAYDFQMGSLPNFGEYADLFDMYKVLAIRFSVEPCVTGNDTNGAIGPPIAMTPMVNEYVRLVVDLDDSTTLGSENAYFEYDNMKSFPVMSSKPFSLTFKPRCLTDIGGIQSISVKPPWIDFQNVAVPHYGVKMRIPTTNFPNGYYICRVIATIFFLAKNRH